MEASNGTGKPKVPNLHSAVLVLPHSETLPIHFVRMCKGKTCRRSASSEAAVPYVCCHNETQMARHVVACHLWCSWLTKQFAGLRSRW